MKKALYRKRICAEKEKLTPEKVFHTPQYRDLLTSIGHEITGGKLTTLRLYDDKNSGIAGWNQGETVAVNLGNQITSSFLTLELKSDSLIGILGHECGHYRYTDSALRKRYAEHMLNGSWYPKEPVPENAQEKEAFENFHSQDTKKSDAAADLLLSANSKLIFKLAQEFKHHPIPFDDLIAEGCLAVASASHIDDLTLTMHAHPTLPESIEAAAELVEYRATDIFNPQHKKT